MDRRLTMSLLCELYQPLLTEWQCDVVCLYHDHDLSLAEIAQIKGVTRTAVYNVLKRAENALEDYEARLGLLKAYQERQKTLDQLEALLGPGDEARKDRIVALLGKLRS
ncbi:MAG: YlxM family DNA-binding protein [Bacillota bacterium]